MLVPCRRQSRTIVASKIVLTIVSVLLLNGDLPAEEAAPLHTQIDSLLDSTRVGTAAETVDDATFARRAYLDLVGRIPSVEEVRSFLADKNENKRVTLVDDLLTRPEFARNMATVFDLMIMERRGGKHVKSDQFRNYLEDSFNQGKSYLELTKEILAADGTEEKNRAAAAFYLERDVEPNLLTREIGRVFFGVDLACAQCHDHPNIDDYRQEDYYGLNAFVVRASLFQPDKKKPALIAEKADGEATFKSVFTDRSSVMGPRVVDGEELVEVSLKPGEQYKVAPAKNVRHVASFSRLGKLSETATSNPTDAFNRNIANRLWAHMFGRGLVYPVDLHHSANPPTHPGLMALLAQDIEARGYDVKSFLRELALSETYQRSVKLPGLSVDVDQAKHELELLEMVSKKQRDLAYEVDVAADKIVAEVDAAMGKLKPFQDAVTNANKAVTEAIKTRDAAAAKVTARKKEIEGKQANLKLVAEANDKTKAAAEALKDDKELATAAATIASRVQVMQAEISKSQEAEKAEVAALNTEEDKLKAANSAADEAIAAAMPVEEEVRVVRAKLIETRDVAADHRRQANIAEQKAADLVSLITYHETQATVATLTKQVPVLSKQRDDLVAATPNLEKAVADNGVIATGAEQTLLQTKEKLSTITVQLEQARDTKGLIADSLAKVQEVAKRIGKEESLKGAQAEISTLLTDQNNEVAKLEKLLATNQEEFNTAQAAAAKASEQLQSAKAKLAEHAKSIENASTQLAKAKSDLEQSQKSLETQWSTIVGEAAANLNTAQVVALTPEQLAWSVLTATGQAERTRVGQAAKLNKEKPLSEADAKDPAKVAQREQEIDAATFTSLQGTVNRFAQLFGAGSGQPQHEFFATADQALFFANGGELRSWLAPSGGNLTDRLNKMEETGELAQELYMSVFCRMPEAAEVAEVAEYLKQRGDQKSAAVQELAWSLITSAEFRFQY